MPAVGTFLLSRFPLDTLYYTGFPKCCQGFYKCFSKYFSKYLDNIQIFLYNYTCNTETGGNKPMTKEELAIKLKQLRQAANLTQQNVADKLQLKSNSTISNRQ